MPLARRLGVPQQELEEGRRDRRTSHSPAVYDSPSPSFAARREPAEEARARGSSRCTTGPGAEAPRRAVRQPHHERAALEPGRRARGRDAPRCRARAGAMPAPAGARARSCPHRALAGDERRLVVERHALQPELERLPVDERRSPAAASAGSGRATRRAIAFVSSLPPAVRAPPSAGGRRPRARRCARTACSPGSREGVAGSAGRARRTARRAAACRARSESPSPPVASELRAAARRTCCSARRSMHASSPSPGSTSRS